jgi:hypothetical protein
MQLIASHYIDGGRVVLLLLLLPPRFGYCTPCSKAETLTKLELKIKGLLCIC